MVTRKQPPSKGKKSLSQKSAPTKSGQGKTADKGNTVVSAYGNTWENVTPGTLADVQVVEEQIGVSLAPDLAEFLMKCGGGRPAKNFFESRGDHLELGVGYVLPLREHPKKGGVASDCLRYRKHQSLDPSLVPFALDRGNANLICMRLPGGDIVYWLHDDPDDRIRKVAPSLNDFLTGLEETPY
jgi:hypothetical protein